MVAVPPRNWFRLFLLVVVVHDLEVGVHDVGLLFRRLLGAGVRCGLGGAGSTGIRTGLLRVSVELGTDLLEVFHGGLHRVEVGLSEGLLGVGDGSLNGGLLVGGDLVARVLEGLFEIVDGAIELVLGLDGVLALAVFLGFEGQNLIARKLMRKGWRLVDVVEAPDLSSAERRFFERALPAGAPAGLVEAAPAPARFAASSAPVIGLFPEANGR